ncbi:MAG: M14 family zinc carboxypeptidase [Solirubrobacteraceae bacterium]
MRSIPVLAAILGTALLAPSAHGKIILDTSLAAQGAVARSCTTPTAAGVAGVATTTARAAHTGVLRLTTAGSGDWDVTVFDRASKRFIAGSAQPGSREIAQGFVAKGQPLLVQACRFNGSASRVAVRATTTPIGRDRSTYKTKVVAVHTPVRADKDRLGTLGLDPAEGATRTTIDVVLHDAEDEARLRKAGFTWTVRIADLGALERSNARAAARQAPRAAVPSGREDYRHLADYEADMKMLAAKNPGLVKLVELNHKTLEGRTVLGVEIAQNVNVDDGKPVFVQLGVHHSREWPAGEAPMEFAFDLVNNYGKAERFTNVVNSSRTIVVPIVNPDGFNLSREATAGQSFDPGTVLGEVDGNLPEPIRENGTLNNPVYIAALLADSRAGTFAYKRRNCRIKDGETPEDGECGKIGNRNLGTDPNRNYGRLWGGPGASADPASDIYRGAGPFSEPETQNVRELVLANQVTTLITNHTFTGLVLYPPGVRAQGTPPDGPALKDLSDRMAAQVGYTSQPGFALYDTTGTTEDWSYAATGGFGYTFEIGKRQFHPPYPEVVGEYEGTGEFAGKGLRGAYLLAAENTIDASKHSTLTGSAPAGTVLRVKKAFDTQTSPVIGADDTVGPLIAFQDTIDDTITVGPTGSFEWHLNPSTRPGVTQTKTTSDPADTPSSRIAEEAQPPVPPGQPRNIPFEVAAGTRLIKAAIVSEGPDYDIYLYEGDPVPQNQVASGATEAASESLFYDYPQAGKYTLQIVNFSAVAPYDYSIETFAPKPGTEQTAPAAKESYTLTCETPTGQVLTTNPLEVDRGETKTMNPCLSDTGPGKVAPVTDSATSGSAADLRFKFAVRKRKLGRALRKGLPVVASCSIECRVIGAATVPRKVAKRFGLAKGTKRVLLARGAMRRAQSGVTNKVILLKFTRKAREKLKRAKLIRFAVIGLATNREGDRVRKVIRVKIRR